MSFWYLASPYSHANPAIVSSRYKKTQSATAWLLKAGIWTYSPIVHCHELALVHDLPLDAEFWQEYNFAMLGASSGLLVLTISGWKESKGLKAELGYAIDREKIIREIAPESYDEVSWKWVNSEWRHVVP